MKTSNKLLSSGLLFLIVSTMAGMMITKNNITYGTEREGTGNGIMTTAVLQHEIKGNHLFLEGNYEYTLDSNWEGIQVKCDDNLVDQIRVSNNESLRFYREGDLRFKPSSPVEINLGIAGLSDLVIEVQDRAILKNLAKMKNDFTVVVQDRGFAELDVQNDKMKVVASDHATLFLTGSTNKVDLIAEDNSKSDMEKLEVSRIDSRITNWGAVKINRCDTIVSIMDGKAKLEFKEEWTYGELNARGLSKILVNGKRWEGKQ